MSTLPLARLSLEHSQVQQGHTFLRLRFATTRRRWTVGCRWLRCTLWSQLLWQTAVCCLISGGKLFNMKHLLCFYLYSGGSLRWWISCLWIIAATGLSYNFLYRTLLLFLIFTSFVKGSSIVSGTSAVTPMINVAMIIALWWWRQKCFIDLVFFLRIHGWARLFLCEARAADWDSCHCFTCSFFSTTVFCNLIFPFTNMRNCTACTRSRRLVFNVLF